VQQVQQATDIVDLISQYVALKKRGKEFVGLCPFHDDHRPSLNVSPTKQIFKCFSCGAGGTAINFLMLYEKLGFPEAVRTLAERANIPLPRDTAGEAQESGPSKNDLLSVTAFAADFFRSQLRSAAGAAALAYARKRGLSEESIKRFALGYAPDSWDALLKAARAKHLTPALLLAAGLIVKKDDGTGCYDRFRNRLIFPIFDAAGSVIAFGGRALDESKQAKYLNSPETPLFDKSAQFYALNWAREAIVSSSQAVVVEGYLDALVPIQAGVGNVVATMGTALTERHVRVLSRYAGDVVLVFDADIAGASAAQRALETFISQRFHVRVATVPAGKDPCDYVLAEGGEAFGRLIAQAPDALKYAWDRCYGSYAAAGARPADRTKIADEFLRLVASSAAYGAIDEIRRGELAQHIGHMLNIPPADLQRHMRRLARQTPRQRLGGAPDRTAETARLAERHIVEVLLNRMDLFDSVAERLDPSAFTSPPLRAIAERLWKLAAEQRLSLDELLACEEVAAQGALVADLAAAGEQRENYEATLAGAVEDLLYRRYRHELEELKAGGFSDETLETIMRHHRQADRRRHPKIT